MQGSLKCELSIHAETLDTRQITASVGSLLRFLDGRTRTELEKSALLRTGTCVCVRHRGADPESGLPFMCAIVQERWMEKLGRIRGDMPGLDVFADGSHKMTRRQLLCVALQPDTDDEPVASSDTFGEENISEHLGEDEADGM